MQNVQVFGFRGELLEWSVSIQCYQILEKNTIHVYVFK